VDEFETLGLSHTLEKQYPDAECFFGEGQPVSYGVCCMCGAYLHEGGAVSHADTFTHNKSGIATRTRADLCASRECTHTQHRMEECLVEPRGSTSQRAEPLIPTAHVLPHPFS
jgi:hypothetical protein